MTMARTKRTLITERGRLSQAHVDVGGGVGCIMEGDEVQFAFHSFKHRIWGKEESEEEWAGPEGRRCAFIFMRGSIEM